MILLVLFAAVQDPVEDLHSPDPAVREAAMEALIRQGDEAAVRPLLRSDNPEVRERAQIILDAIARRREREARFGPIRRVTLRAGGEPLVDVLRRLRDESGLAFTLESVPVDARVTCDVHDEHPWEALTRITIAAGAARFDPVDATVRGGAPADYPRLTRDHWTVWLRGVTATRETFGTQVEDSGFVDLTLTWLTREDPLQVWLEVFSITDERGDDHAVARPRGRDAPITRYSDRSVNASGRIAGPAVDAQRLTIEGEARLLYPIRDAEWSVRVADAESGQTTSRLGAFPTTLSWSRPESARIDVVLSIEGETAAPPQVEVFDTDGGTIEGALRSRTAGAAWNAWTFSFPTTEDRPPAEARVTLAVETETVTIPFRFENVPLR